MDEDLSVSPLQNYPALSDSVFAHYEAGQQREALALLDGTGPRLTPWQAEIACLRACLYGSQVTAGQLHGAPPIDWWERGTPRRARRPVDAVPTSDLE